MYEIICMSVRILVAQTKKKKKKKDWIQYISFNVKNTSAQKTDLRWEAMANICSVCSYGLFSGIAAVIRPQTAEYKNVTSMNFDTGMTQHVCNVSWHTHMNMYTPVWCQAHEHRTGPVQTASAWMSKLLESESLQRSFLFRQVWKFLFVQLQSVFLFFRFLLQFYRFLAHSQDEVLALYRSGQLCEFALAVDHFQVLNVVPDVGGALQWEGVVRVWIRRRRRNHFWVLQDHESGVWSPVDKQPPFQNKIWRNTTFSPP